MSDFLKAIFQKQKILQDRIEDQFTGKSSLELMTSNNLREKEYVSNWNVLAMHAELSEFLEWSNWKMHKKTRYVYDDERIMEMHIELVDILHYYVNLCIIWGLTPEKLVQIFESKNAENHNRQDRKY